MTTIYIAGPMSGLPNFNYPAFNAAEKRLLAAGFHTSNPTVTTAFEKRMPPPSEQGRIYSWYLRAGLHRLITCDAVALLPGWEKSTGANLEVHVARKLGLTIQPLESWLE